MSKKIIYTLCAISIGLNLGMIGMTVLNRAAPPGPPPQGREIGPDQPQDPGWIIENHVVNITQHLGLDEAQTQAIREIMTRYVPSLIRLRMDAETANGRLSEVFAAPDFDPDSFRQGTMEASHARALVDSLSAQILVEEAAVLTPEQRRRFAEVAPSIHSQPSGGPPRGGPPPRGRRPDEGPPPR